LNLCQEIAREIFYFSRKPIYTFGGAVFSREEQDKPYQVNMFSQRLGFSDQDNNANGIIKKINK
jgi:hypothetical protein